MHNQNSLVGSHGVSHCILCRVSLFGNWIHFSFCAAFCRAQLDRIPSQRTTLCYAAKLLQSQLTLLSNDALVYPRSAPCALSLIFLNPRGVLSPVCTHRHVQISERTLWETLCRQLPPHIATPLAPDQHRAAAASLNASSDSPPSSRKLSLDLMPGTVQLLHPTFFFFIF